MTENSKLQIPNSKETSNSNPDAVYRGWNSEFLTRQRSTNTKVIREQGPALVIAPAALDFQHTPGEALADKTALFDKCDGCAIVRLNVRFDAMEFQFAEGVFEDKQHSFAHESPAGMGFKGVISE